MRKFYWKPWELVFESGRDSVVEFQEFDGYLYAGTGANGFLYRSVDGVDWEDIHEFAGGNTIFALASFNGYLYAGFSGANVLQRSSDGTSWTTVETFSDPIRALYVFDEQLYVGTYTNGYIYVSSDGTTFSEDFDSGQVQVRAFYGFKHYLYAGSSNSAKIYRKPDTYMQQFVDPNYIFESLSIGTGNRRTIYIDQGNSNVYTAIYSATGKLQKQTGGTGAFVNESVPDSYWQKVVVNETTKDVYALEVTGLYYQAGGIGAYSKIYTGSNGRDLFINQLTGDVYMLIDSGLYKQTGGVGSFVNIAFSGINPTYVLVNQSNDDIYLIEAFGSTYKQSSGVGPFVDQNVSPSNFITSGTINNSNQNIYLSDAGGYIYCQYGGGGDFVTIVDWGADYYFVDVEINSINGDVVICAREQASPGVGIYIQNGGIGDFVRRSSSSQDWQVIAINESLDIIYITTSSDDLFQSDITYWQEVFDGSTNVIFSFTDKRGYMYTGTNEGQIYRTKDGVNWELYEDIEGAQGIIEILNYKGHLYTATGPNGEIFKEHNTKLLRT